MKFVRVNNILFNTDHIITVEKDPDSKERSKIFMTNGDVFFLTISLNEAISQLKIGLK